MVNYYLIFGKTIGLDRSHARDLIRSQWKEKSGYQLPEYLIFSEDEERLIIDNLIDNDNLPPFIHLGSDFPGLMFAFHCYRQYDAFGVFEKLESIRNTLDSGVIVSDRNARHSTTGFFRIIESKRNCRRHKLDKKNCIAHGEGPWDFMSDSYFDFLSLCL